MKNNTLVFIVVIGVVGMGAFFIYFQYQQQMQAAAAEQKQIAALQQQLATQSAAQGKPNTNPDAWWENSVPGVVNIVASVI